MGLAGPFQPACSLTVRNSATSNGKAVSTDKDLRQPTGGTHSPVALKEVGKGHRKRNL